VEQSDNGTFKLRTTAGVDSGRRESFPDDRFTDVGRYEQGNTGPKAIAFLKKFVEKDDDESSGD